MLKYFNTNNVIFLRIHYPVENVEVHPDGGRKEIWEERRKERRKKGRKEGRKERRREGWMDGREGRKEISEDEGRKKGREQERKEGRNGGKILTNNFIVKIFISSLSKNTRRP